MGNLSNAFSNALLADVTYAIRDGSLDGETGEDLANNEQVGNRMTPTLAKYIGDNFTVVTHIETGDVFGSGFDATVWHANNGDGTPNAGGKLYVSMQGTAGLQDFLSDVDLATTANARNQIVDMVNWWFKITTPVGQSARQIQLEPQYDNSTPPILLGSHYAAAPDVPGTGLISAADLARGIEVNGHSLGGYLATAFTRLFGAYAHVEHTSTFNSAGFAPGSEAVFAELQNLIGPSYGLGRFPNASEQTNYFAAVGENDATIGNTDVMRFLQDVAIDQLWFRRTSNHLEVSIIGTEDKATINNWYRGAQHQLERFEVSEGQALLNAQVDSLVQAMAAFAPPPMGQSTLPPDYAQTLAPLIAASWN